MAFCLRQVPFFSSGTTVPCGGPAPSLFSPKLYDIQPIRGLFLALNKTYGARSVRLTSISQALVLCTSVDLNRHQTGTQIGTPTVPNSMPGGLGAGLGQSKSAYGLPPPLSRAHSMHPAEMVDFELSLEVPDVDSNAPSEVPSPHEPLNYGWTAGDSSAPQDALQHLPPLPPLETAPLGGPLTRSFSAILHDDAKFLRPAPKAAPTRHIIPTTPLVANKKRRAETAAAEPSTTLASTTAAPSHVPPPAPRKKRRGLRPGTYLCLFKGELYECPHGCDIVDKSLLYDLLRRQ